MRKFAGRKSAGFLLLLLCLVPGLNAQKTRFGEGLPKAKPGVSYPIKIHVSGIRLRSECESVQLCEKAIYADAILDGQKIELPGYVWLTHELSGPALLPGDYQARLVKDPPTAMGTPLFREYEILLPDGTVWKSSVTGISE